MPELPLQHSLFGYHRKSASITEAFFSTYPNLIESMVNPITHQEINKNIMEPFTDTCFTANNTMVKEMALSTHMECEVTLKEKTIIDKQNYNALRRWKRFGEGKLQVDADDAFVFRLLSFNILAQNLLEAHPYLYLQHDRQALHWDVRKPLLLQEILGAQADVICLQEMQKKHLSEFVKPFKELGYSYLFKKRTNNKEDGLLFLYRSDLFNLDDYAKVELYQPGVGVLNRDNVGIVAKLSLCDSPNTQIVIATTHLLFNPRRNDVRLAQAQLLLTEIERIAFIENTALGPKYLPIILCGDFNLEPHTGVYKFITEGVFQYYGKGRNLEPAKYHGLSNSLIPPRLQITDNCQYFHLLIKRLKEDAAEDTKDAKFNNMQDKLNEEVNINNTESQVIEIKPGHYVKFSSGTLTHPFKLRSLYKHENSQGEKEATTNQGEWITVDYIFYSDIEPVDKYILPTIEQCTSLPTVPNFAVGSDHLCIGATFKILKKK